VCPNNCGTAEQGGGTCRIRASDNAVLCSTCNSDKLLHRGRCNLELNCRAGRVTSGPLTNQSRSCLDRNNCHCCRRNATGDICRRCRSGSYLLNSECLASCPADMTEAGIGLWGRRCLGTFVCRSGAIGQIDSSGVFTSSGESFGCKCPAPGNLPSNGCFMCDFRAGERGERCLRCGSGTFLHNETCHASCAAAGVPSYISVVSGSYGRSCQPGPEYRRLHKQCRRSRQLVQVLEGGNQRRRA